LKGDKPVLGLLRNNPFPDAPPKFVRALLYEYHFATPEDHRTAAAIWDRKLVGLYFPAVSLDDEGFRQAFMAIAGE